MKLINLFIYYRMEYIDFNATKPKVEFHIIKVITVLPKHKSHFYL